MTPDQLSITTANTVVIETINHLIQGVFDPAIVIGTGGSVWMLNQAARDLLGCQDVESLTPLVDLLTNSTISIQSLLESPSPDAFPVTFESVLQINTAQFIPVMVRATAFFQDDGQFIASIWTIRSLLNLLPPSSENKCLLSPNCRHLAEMALLENVAAAGASTLRVDVLIEKVTELIGDSFLPADHFGVILIDEQWKQWQPHPTYRGNVFNESPADLERGVIGRAVATRQPQRLADVTQDPDYLAANPDVRSLLCIPLEVDEQVLGVLNLESTKPNAFSAADERFMVTLSGQLATAIEKNRLFDYVIDSELRYRAVSEMMTDYVYAIQVTPDGEAEVEWITRAFERITGYKVNSDNRTEVVNRAIFPKDNPELARRWQTLLGNEWGIWEYQITTKTGETRWIRDYARPIFDSTVGRVVRIYGAAQDITEHRQSEKAYQSLIEHSLQGLMLFYENDTLLVNHAAAQIFGYTRDELHQKSRRQMYELLHPDDQPHIWSEFRRQIETQSVATDLEFRIVCKDGAIRWLRCDANLVDYYGKQVFQLAFVDITERKQFEETLLQNEERYRLISELAADFAFAGQFNMVNAKLSLYWITGAVSHIVGYTIEEFAILIEEGELFNIVHPPDVPLASAYAQGLMSGAPQWAEFRLVSTTGELHWVHVRTRVLEDDSEHQTMRIYTTVHDVTDRKAIATELENNVQKLKIIEGIGQAIVANLDIDVALQRVIEELPSLVSAERIAILLREDDELVFKATTGRKAEKFEGLRIPVTSEVVAQAIHTGQTIWLTGTNVQGQIDSKARELASDPPQSLIVVPLKQREEIIGLLSVSHTDPEAFTNDDLQRLEMAAVWISIAINNAYQFMGAERRVRESQAIATIARALNQTLDLDAVLQLIVDYAYHILPGVERAVIHLLDSEQQTLSPAAVAGREPWDIAGAIMRAGQGVAGRVITEGIVINVRDAHNDPRYLPLESTTKLRSLLVAPIQYAGGSQGTISVISYKPHAFSSEDEWLIQNLGMQAALALRNARLFEDVQQALAQEQDTRAQLVQSEKLAAMGRLVASVAHELNNPIQAIQNALFLIKYEEELSPQMLEDIEVVSDETERMARLINRLRDTYRPALSENFAPEPINALITDTQRLMNTHMRHRHIEVVFNPDPDLPGILCVRDQLKQVFLNLSLNAVEAMPNGGSLTITTHHLPETSQVLITFQDTGYGISAEKLERIFDAFFTTKESGTGLGLAITHDIVQRHQGKIIAESQLGQGTTFKIWLPISPITDLDLETDLINGENTNYL